MSVLPKFTSSEIRSRLTLNNDDIPSAFDEILFEKNPAQTRTLAFVDRSIEAAYLDMSRKQQGKRALNVIKLTTVLLGIAAVLDTIGSSDPTNCVGCMLFWGSFFIMALSVLVTSYTTVGKIHLAELVTAMLLFGFSMLTVYSILKLGMQEPGALREPNGGLAIPACATLTSNNGTACPIDVNFTSSVSFRESIPRGGLRYSSQACYSVAHPSGEKSVMEMRIWAPGQFNSEKYQLTFRFVFMMWSILGLTTTLLLSMRFVHAGLSVGLPGFVYMLMYCTSTASSPVFTLVVHFLPAFVTILGTSFLMESASRSLFITARRIQRMLDHKDELIRSKNTALRSNHAKIKEVETENAGMKEELMAAQKMVDRVMKDALRAYELPHADIDFGDVTVKLGEGSFGTVFKATLRGEHEVAVKTMRVSAVSFKQVSKFKAELMIMCPLHHPNLVRLHGGIWNEGIDKLCIVLEFCHNGSLTRFLRATTETWADTRQRLALGVARCLRYLHHELNETLIHRDIKPENILVSDRIESKLADFGESKLVSQKAESNLDGHGALAMTIVGTRLYSAPEILLSQRYNECVDTFSFALVLLCLIVGDVDFIVKARQSERFNLIAGERPCIPPKVERSAAGIVALIREMWNQDYSIRPSFLEIVPRLESSVVLPFEAYDANLEENVTAQTLMSTLPPNPVDESCNNATTADTVVRLEAELRQARQELNGIRMEMEGVFSGFGDGMRYVKICEIGRGTSAVCFLVQRDGPGQEKKYALKKLECTQTAVFETTGYGDEVGLMLQMDHPNVVRLYGSYVENNHLHMLLEFCAGGTLANLIGSCRVSQIYLPEIKILAWFVQALSALEHIHGHNVLHRDISPNNIFLSSSGCIKLGDFGVSKQLTQTQRFASTIVGTQCYISPEVWMGEPPEHYSEDLKMIVAGILAPEKERLTVDALLHDISLTAVVESPRIVKRHIAEIRPETDSGHLSDVPTVLPTLAILFHSI